jgi:hypothetical protein
MSEFRPEFESVLEIVGRAFERVVAQGRSRPVIVGGAAVEYYTGGAIMSGDCDIVAVADMAFEAALLAEGFRREDRPGHVQRGFYHPDFAIGIEIVGDSLFGGETDASRINVIDLP